MAPPRLLRFWPTPQQADEIGAMQTQIAELEAQLRREKHHSELLQQQVQQLRGQASNGTSAAAGPFPASGGAARPAVAHQHRLHAPSEAASGAQPDLVTITQKEYQLLLLKVCPAPVRPHTQT